MRIAAPATPNHTELAQRSYDSFAAAYDTVAALPKDAPSDVTTAVAQVTEGVALLGKAYAAIPAGDYNPGNEALTSSWAADAVRELRSGATANALRVLDEILERVSNDFDLG